MEAARFFNYTLGEWEKEHHVTKARVIAHYLEHGIRKGYADEKRAEEIEAEARGKKRTGQTPTPEWGKFRQGGGVDYESGTILDSSGSPVRS